MPGSPGTAPAPDLPPGPRFALLVATSDYADPRLKNLDAPAHDALALRTVLADPEIGGFDVTSVINEPLGVIRETVEGFLTDRSTRDLLLVYLSCHGILNDHNTLFFAAANTRKDRLASTAIDSPWIKGLLEQCRARRKILILDCCFSGAFGSTKGADDIGLRNRFAGRGWYVLTASTATEFALEGDRAEAAARTESVFTAALVAGLRTGAADTDHDGYITVEEAYTYAFDQVRATRAGQTPQLSAHDVQGTIVLARSPAGRPVEHPALDDALRALTSLRPGIRIAAVRELGELLHSGDPAQERAALAQLRNTADTDTPEVARAAREVLAAHRTAGAVADRPAPDRAMDSPQPLPKPSSAQQVKPPPAQVRAWPPKPASDQPGSGRSSPPTTGPAAQIPSGHLPALDPHAKKINAMSFSPDGKLLATGDGSSRAIVRFWYPRSGRSCHGRMRGAFAVDDSALFHSNVWMEFSPDGRQLAASGMLSLRVDFWDPASGQPEYGTRLPRPGADAGFSPDGRRLAVACENGTVHWYDPATVERLDLVRLGQGMGTLKRLASGRGPFGSMMFSPGLRALVTAGGDILRLWDPKTGELRGSVRLSPGPPDPVVGEAPVILGISPDGNLIAVGERLRRGVTLYDVATGMARYEVSGDYSAGVAFSHDGTVLATSQAGQVLLWEVATGRQKRVLNPEPRPSGADIQVSCMAFGPQAGVLAVAECTVVPVRRGPPTYQDARVWLWA